MRTALILISLAVCNAAAEKCDMGSLCGHAFYVRTEDEVIDTLGWYRFEHAVLAADSSDRRGPGDAVETFAAQGKAIYRLTDLSAIVTAIVHDLGYPLVAFTRWNAHTTASWSLTCMPEEDARYKVRRLATDYLWEKLDKATISPPARLGGEFAVRLQMGKHDFSDFDGRDDICARVKKVTTPGHRLGITDKFSRTDHEQSIERRIFQVYVVVPDNIPPRTLISRIESKMDALKLGLDYAVPQVSRVE